MLLCANSYAEVSQAFPVYVCEQVTKPFLASHREPLQGERHLCKEGRLNESGSAAVPTEGCHDGFEASRLYLPSCDGAGLHPSEAIRTDCERMFRLPEPFRGLDDK